MIGRSTLCQTVNVQITGCHEVRVHMTDNWVNAIYDQVYPSPCDSGAAAPPHCGLGAPHPVAYAARDSLARVTHEPFPGLGPIVDWPLLPCPVAHTGDFTTLILNHRWTRDIGPCNTNTISRYVTSVLLVDGIEQGVVTHVRVC